MAADRRLALLGSTGSIGCQTFEVIEALGGYRLVVLSAHSQWELLARQAIQWKPEVVTIADENSYSSLKDALFGQFIKVMTGPDACREAVAELEYDIALNGLVGLSGLQPSYEVIRRGIDLALANKESLVLGGDYLNAIRAKTGSALLPVDSEHSAIFQCLFGEKSLDIHRLILTASGGPFRTWSHEQIAGVTPEQALKHPNWKMGAKVTIDSATLMNKGLEVIEAYHLFGLPIERIEVRIHPVSIVHSLVQFIDGSFKAQLGKPDMRLPIQVALNHPGRAGMPFLLQDDPTNWPALEFQTVDMEKFPCLRLAYEALVAGGTVPAVVNGADEAAVERFLKKEIRFTDIARIIASAIQSHTPRPADSIETLLSANDYGRQIALGYSAG